jgi:hypothetical protein
MAFIGVDLHQNSFTVCRRDAGGGEAFARFTLTPDDLSRFCLGLDADDELAVEATGNSAWFRDQVVSCVGGLSLILCGGPVYVHQTAKRSPKMTANCVLASNHSRGGRFHSSAA